MKSCSTSVSIIIQVGLRKGLQNEIIDLEENEGDDDHEKVVGHDMEIGHDPSIGSDVMNLGSTMKNVVIVDDGENDGEDHGDEDEEEEHSHENESEHEHVEPDTPGGEDVTPRGEKFSLVSFSSY